jgi:hypothetical protein
VYNPCVKDVSEKIKRIRNLYDIRTVIGTKHTLRSSLMRSRPERDPQQTTQCVFSIPCEFGGSYSAETGIPLAVRFREHRHSLKEELEKSKLAQHSCEEG